MGSDACELVRPHCAGKEIGPGLRAPREEAKEQGAEDVFLQAFHQGSFAPSRRVQRSGMYLNTRAGYNVPPRLPGKRSAHSGGGVMQRSRLPNQP